MIDRRGITRFVQYSTIGGGTFLFDLLLLFLFIDILGIHYLTGVAIAFLIAISCNYVLSRKYIFYSTKRSHAAGYTNFVIIAGVGLCFVTLSMFVMVDILDQHHLVSRVIVAAVTGIWNYLMNLFVNFKVAGNYSSE
jgi:putative flippase GtrA